MAASLANGASFSMILPLLAPLIRQLKLTEIQAGALVSIGALLMAIAAIYISKQQSKYSIYQLLSIGFVGMTITWGLFTATLMFGLINQVSLVLLFTLLMFSRASTGLFMAMPQIALQSYVMTNFTDEKERSQKMSKFGALNSLGLIFGPLLTTVFLYWGILTPLWAAIMILASMSILILFQFDRGYIFEHEKSVAHQNKMIQTKEFMEIKNQQGSVFGLKQCFPWLVLGFSLYLAIVTLNLTAGFYIQDRFEVSITEGAVYFAQCSLIVGVALVSMQVIITKYLKWSVQQLLWIGLIVMMLALVITIYTEHLIIFQLTYILYGISVACLIPAFTTGASQNASAHDQVKAAGWCTATQAISFVFGPLLSTGLYQLDQQYPYYFLLLVMACLIIYWLFSSSTTNSHLELAKQNKDF